MKAIVYTKYGSPAVLRFEDVDKPFPKDNEVLIRIHAACVNYATSAYVRGKPRALRTIYGLVGPKHRIPGSDVAGRVEAVGKDVAQLNPGDEVFGDLAECGFGAFAEFACAPEDQLALKPSNATFEEAASVPQAGLVALQGLRHKGRIESGQRVLICGASGGIGTFAVQIAKSFGADVTGVCSTRNVELVYSLGADHVIDYTQQDFAASGQQYDLILATVGYRSIRDYERALTPTGRYVMSGGSMKQIMEASLRGPSLSKAGGKQLCSVSHKTSQDDLRFMKGLIEAGQVRPVVDRSFPLSEAADALRYYETRKSQGKVVITMHFLV
ncbi:NAD(P)-dependent alcohol dehydrogenase [Candidatus Bipolaricaulota bacterium]